MGWIIAAVAVLLPLLVLLSFRVGRRLLSTFFIAAKYGTLYLTGVLHLTRRLQRPMMLRLIFEDLGSTYIKLGQIIASSPGLFTDRYVDEFRNCLDRVRPFPFERAMSILREDLGDTALELVVESQPLASASIAQVHGARDEAGEDLVVKIQRPEIQGLIEADLTIMRFWARVAAALLPTVRLANPVGIVEDFSKTIHEELDFVKEGENIDEFNRIMGELGHDQICAPRVDWPRTTRRVLTMERFHGHNVDDVETIRASTVDAEGKLLEGMRAWFQCVMFYGLFHGDVHAGNLMWLDDGRIGFLDFGIVGRFDSQQRKMVTRYVMSFATGQFQQLAEVMVEMGSATATVDVQQLTRDVERAYAPLRQMNFAEMKYIDLLPNILRMARRHQLRLPREFVLIVKQVLYFDRYAKLLAPDLNVFTDPRVFSALAQDVARALAQA